MKKIFSILFISFYFITNINAQAVPSSSDDPMEMVVEYAPPPPPPGVQVKYANTITSKELRQHIDKLASDEFEGRETGKPGQKLAAKYIADDFKSNGLPAIGDDNSYYQNVPYLTERWDNLGIVVKNKRYINMRDFYSFGSINQNRPELKTKEVIFLGYGIDDENYSDYKGVDVKDKVIMIYAGEPMSKDSIYTVTGTKEPSKWSKEWRLKYQTAHQKGAKTVLVVQPRIKKQINRFRRFLMDRSFGLSDGNDGSKGMANSLTISTDIAKAIVGKKYKKFIKKRDKARAKGIPAAIKLKTDLEIYQKEMREDLIGENVLGYIEGSHPKLKEEVVIITAHFDHLGKRGENIYNGADDNASGTSCLIEIAEAFAQARQDGQQPKRSVLVMLVSGEEKGLLGSEYYVNNPTFPLKNTVVNLNVDMVGRVDKRHKDGNYVYVIGADRLSTELHKINEKMNRQHINIELDYKYNEKSDPNRYYYRSDHYNFAERGIPAAFYFNGTHEDYHMATDTPEKIDTDKMEKIAKLVFHTAWEIADRKKRIVVDVKE